MKKLAVITGIFTIFILFISLSSAVVGNPIANWKFEGNAVDSSINKIDGIIRGTVNFVDGISGKAASFNGNIANYIEVLYNEKFDFKNKDFTISAWVKSNVDSMYGGIIEKTVNGQVNTQYLMFAEKDASTNIDNYIVRTKDFNGGIDEVKSPGLDNGKWVHLIMTYKSSNAEVKMYRDGAYVGNSLIGFVIANGVGPIFIGKLGSNLYPFNGLIDELSIYDALFTDAEVMKFYKESKCSFNNQKILKLSSLTNSHAEIYSKNNYKNVICYDEIFGSPYVPVAGADPHLCSVNNGNIVLKLSSETNAHVEGPLGTNYPINICYGDLKCALKTTCLNTEKVVASLSSTTNSHISYGDDPLYPQKLCCSATLGNGQINSVDWTDLKDTVITNSNKLCTVRLAAKLQNAQNGEIVKFKITKRTGINVELATLSGAVSENTAKADWFIEESYFDKIAEGSELDFNFEAIAGDGTGINQKKTSGMFKVKNVDCPFIYPTVRITGPEHRQIYFTGTNINFEYVNEIVNSQIASAEWRIDEEPLSDANKIKKSFSNVFTQPGQKTITIKLIDGRGKSAEDQIGIILLGNINENDPLAFIEKPRHKEVIHSDPKSDGMIVNYMAKDSYVIQQTGAITSCQDNKIVCLAGICPVITKNAPSGINNCPISSNLAVSKSTDIIVGDEFKDIKFDWTSERLALVPSGLGKSFGKVNYFSPGQKIIILLLSYNKNNVNVQKQFNRTFTVLPGNAAGVCDLAAGEFKKIKDGNVIESLPIMKTIGCAGNDILNSNDDCCPAGWTCSTKIGESGCRLLGDKRKTTCSSQDESNCNNFNGANRNYGPLTDQQSKMLGCDSPPKLQNGCWIADTCKCEWNGPKDTGKCTIVKKNNIPISPDNPDINLCGEATLCKYEVIEETLCGEETEFQKIKMVPVGNSHVSCTPKEFERVPCGRSVIELPFSGIMQITAALIIIILIYLMTRKRK